MTNATHLLVGQLNGDLRGKLRILFSKYAVALANEQVAAIARRYMRQMIAIMQAAGGNGAGKNNDYSGDGTVQMGLNLEKMMANQQAAEKERMEIFGVAKTECFTSPRTAHGDEIVMEAHRAARAVIREVAPHIRLGLDIMKT